jgi:hypothetical protein
MGTTEKMEQESFSKMLLSYSRIVLTFRHLKQHVGGLRFHNNEEVEVAARKWLRMQEPDFYREGIFELVPSWD